jgi:excisionase family DNA binding protein
MMNDEFRIWLQTLVDAEATVPARMVLERLPLNADAQKPAVGSDLADLTADEVAREFGRSASTVRGWLGEGRFPGAYRLNGREWRIPRADVIAWLSAQRPAAACSKPKRTRLNGTPDLSSWRKHTKKTG